MTGFGSFDKMPRNKVEAEKPVAKPLSKAVVRVLTKSANTALSRIETYRRDVKSCAQAAGRYASLVTALTSAGVTGANHKLADAICNRESAQHRLKRYQDQLAAAEVELESWRRVFSLAGLTMPEPAEDENDDIDGDDADDDDVDGFGDRKDKDY